MTVVPFDYSWWSDRYPELATYTPAMVAEGYFEQATGLLDNTNLSPVTDFTRRQVLLGLLTSHIAALFAPVNGQPSPQAVGRIASASEGSVSVSFDFTTPPGAEWYAQTKYGMTYWTSTTRYRTMRYYPGPTPFRQFGGRWGGSGYGGW